MLAETQEQIKVGGVGERVLVTSFLGAHHWKTVIANPGAAPARHALMRCWASPAPEPAPEPAGETPQATRPQGRWFLAPEPPPRPARLAPGDYEAVTERYERQVIEAGLAQGHGRIAETCRLLGISRNTLRERMKRYGLGPAGLIGDGTEGGD